MAGLVLFDYWRSSAAYRVRIGLNLKGIQADHRFINLAAGAQSETEYARVNPQKLVPALVTEAGTLTQSLAILEWLDETHPQPSLLPGGAFNRAKIRAFALAIACDIHPLNNLRVLKHLRGSLGQDEAGVNAWYLHWIAAGLSACEAMLAAEPLARFSFGDAPTLADICLVPQMANARRYKADLASCPRLSAIDAACRSLDAFASAAPEAQADAVKPA